jgi:hypothetical protein
MTTQKKNKNKKQNKNSIFSSLLDLTVGSKSVAMGDVV